MAGRRKEVGGCFLGIDLVLSTSLTTDIFFRHGLSLVAVVMSLIGPQHQTFG